MLRPTLADEHCADNQLTQAITRHRIFFFLLLGLIYAISFNGHWRVGQDSAIYRGLAASLAEGKGYVFGEWASRQAYPGLPLLLAGVQRACGTDLQRLRAHGAFAFVDRRLDTTLSVCLILFLALLTLILTFKLMRLHYPQWMAVCVTFGVGINSWFLQLSHELLTDVPFLFAVVMAIYGWELLQRAQSRVAAVRALVLIIFGLVIAGSMRPMFWVLAISWIAVCTMAMIRGTRRRLHAVCLVVLLASWALLKLLDPRDPGSLNPLNGAYEREVLAVLPELPRTLPARLHESLRHTLPASFFGEQMSPLSIPASLVLLGSCLLLFRNHPLWGTMVFVAWGVTLVASSEARYYTMVLPMMLLGWLLMLMELCRRLPQRWRGTAMFVGLGMVTVTNLTASVGFIREQRAVPFIEHYKHGRYVQLLRMCDLIRVRVGEDERVLGPLASVMSYVTGKHVLSQREVLGRSSVLNYPAAVRAAQLNAAVFPASIYRVKQPFIARLMERNIIAVRQKIGWADKWYLARVRIHVPDVADWRQLPKGWTPPPPLPKPPKKTPKPTVTQPVKKKRPAPPATRTTPRPTTRPATHPATRSTARPTSRPTTAPSSQSDTRRAITMMLSPVRSLDSGNRASGVSSQAGSARIRSAACLSAGETRRFPQAQLKPLSTKYSLAAGRIKPVLLSTRVIRSRSSNCCGALL